MGNADGGLLEGGTKASFALPQRLLALLAIGNIPGGPIDQVPDWR